MQENNEKHSELALWRYSIIAPLLHLPAGVSLTQAARDLAAQPKTGPHGEATMVSVHTVLRWFRDYHLAGLEGLQRDGRADRGRSRVLDATAVAILLDLSGDHPDWSIKAVHREAQKQLGRVLPIKAVYRLLQGHGKAVREAPDEHRRRPTGVPQVLWLADTWHGPLVYGPGRAARKSYLLAFLDDASRAVMAGQFFLRDDVASLMLVFRQALLARGVPHQLITDNGSNYKSRAMRTACARLKIHLIHAPAGAWSWKARLERFNLTVKLQLLPKLSKFPTMQELQTAWARFVAEYHAAQHDGLKKAGAEPTAPLAFYLAHLPQEVQQVSELSVDDLLYIEEVRRVNLDGTIRVAGKLFEVRAGLAGTRVVVRFNPAHPAAAAPPPRVFYRPAQDSRASFEEAFLIQ
jgi:transposase